MSTQEPGGGRIPGPAAGVRDPLQNPDLLQDLVNGIADPIFIKDLQGRYVLMNRAGAEACGRGLEEILGHTDTELFPPAIASGLQARDAATLRTGRTEVVEERLELGGRVLHYLVTKIPCRDATGQVTGLIGVARDLAAAAGRPGAARPDSERLARIIGLQQEIGPVGVDPVHLLQKIADTAQELLDATGAAVLLAEGAEARFAATSGCARPLTGRRIAVAHSLAGRSLIDGLPLHTDDAWEDARVDRGIARELGARSFLTVPVHEGGRVIGVLVVMHQAARAFTKRDLQAVHLLGGTLSSALSRAAAFNTNARLLQERTAALAALRESEDRLQAAMEAAQIAIWEWDVGRDRLTWLGEHAAVFGEPPAGADRSFGSFMSRVHPEDRPDLDRAITVALTSGAVFSHSYRVVQPDGKIRWLGARGRFHYGPGGAPDRMYGAAIDLTERRALEHQLLQAQKIEAIGQLAAGIAHEINTPTQYVGDNLRFLQEAFGGLADVLRLSRVLAEAARAAGLAVGDVARAWQAADGDFLLVEAPRALSQALDGVERVSEIVRAMKDFSHPGGGEPIPVDLNRAIENTLVVSRNEWKYVAEVRLDLAPELPPVPCQPGEVQQVLLNLVVNAAHAIADVVGDSPARGLITIRTRATDEAVEVRVEDTGIGIPPEVQPRIFEPFFTTKPVGRGTGQGLAISRDVIVRRHRGTLSFETEAGRGTTFIVRLPLHPADRLGEGA